MRVIAGSRRSIPLKTMSGDNTRPTTDRIKETLFNMINDDVISCNFLDIFAGSGQIGIEALSRGASTAYFIENNREALACINDNLIKTRFTEEAKVINKDVISALNTISGIKFDVIFMDPPYRKGFEKDVLAAISRNALLSDDGIVIIEAALDDSFPFIDELGYRVYKEKNYKTNKHIFLCYKG